jgi:hypothetical protein
MKNLKNLFIVLHKTVPLRNLNGLEIRTLVYNIRYISTLKNGCAKLAFQTHRTEGRSNIETKNQEGCRDRNCTINTFTIWRGLMIFRSFCVTV